MSRNESLPASWMWVPLAELLSTIETGKSFKCDERPPKIDEVGVVKVSAVSWGEYQERESKTCLDADRVNPDLFIQEGDFLFSRANTQELVGACVIAKKTRLRIMLSDKILRFRLSNDAMKQWLLDFLRSANGRLQIEELASGNQESMRNIGQERIGQILIPLAPTSEQTRIAEKLEELLSDLDAGVTELKAAQAKLVRYRQSLLKAAVEGALTAEWRQHNTPEHTGAQLLQRILTECRARWEAKQLAKFAEQDKAPPKDWQQKYLEPMQPDIADLPELPDGWVWTSIDALIDDGPQNGLYLPANRYGRGTPILRIDDYQIYWQRPRLDLNLVEADSSEVEQYSLRPDDVVINRVNSMTHLGKSLLISSLLEGALFESNMMRLRMSTHLDVSYIVYYLGSQTGRARLTRDAKWAVNQASINQKDVRRTPIPLPSSDEQSEIVTALRAQLSALRNQSEAIVFSLKQSTAQRKNILRAAFSGQLVPQDPNDEPASALLARIRAGRIMRQQTETKSRATIRGARDAR